MEDCDPLGFYGVRSPQYLPLTSGQWGYPSHLIPPHVVDVDEADDADADNADMNDADAVRLNKALVEEETGIISIIIDDSTGGW